MAGRSYSAPWGPIPAQVRKGQQSSDGKKKRTQLEVTRITGRQGPHPGDRAVPCVRWEVAEVT